MFKLICIFTAIFLLSTPALATAPNSEACHQSSNWTAIKIALHDKKISPKWRDGCGRSLILLNVLYGSESAAIKHFYRAKKLNIFVDNEQIIMKMAIKQNLQRFVSVILKNGESSNSIDKKDYSPLMVAASVGNLEMMRLLINSGAKLYYEPYENQNAINFALKNGSPYAFDLLVDSGVKLSYHRQQKNEGELIFSAINGNNLSALNVLLKHGFNLNIKNNDGDTPLLFAIGNSASRSIVEQLLNLGADECLKNLKEETAKQINDRLAQILPAWKLDYDGLFIKECQ
ncbi:ankyrin repeat domain-containing protein [Undibacterium flavidum]|uniref:Ankyrin repeat domain-containing protein n=1 Tax=Undibacterium flavidum TaxID=2762297 RepID=A0ABR6YCP8_9BURK|nr:ankyrin repeat domain-containing protein [Undibacterium flavidum]MBC3874316.1 ankyrin repeat domain-containing protein [Undibacterium flavidum]